VIRQTAAGPEQFCASCMFAGEPFEDCWLPLTAEFFPRKIQGTRIERFEHRCKTCKELARKGRRMEGRAQECAA
jgi:hypothetical protein